MVGVGDTDVRAGFIGEIGTTWPWTDNEKKVVRAAVAAQRETGAVLMIHPGRHERLPLEIASFIRKEGADLGRTIMCHIERTIADPAVLACPRCGGRLRVLAPVQDPAVTTHSRYGLPPRSVFRNASTRSSCAR